MNSRTDTELPILYTSENDAEARAALDELVRRHDSRLRAAAFRQCGGNQADADDLFGIASLQLWRVRGKYQPSPAPWISWAVRVVAGGASTKRRRKNGKLAIKIQVNSEVAEWSVGNEKSPERQAFNSKLRKDVASCTRSLNEEQQAVFFLRFVLGLTFKRVTELLRLDEAERSASSIFHDAMKIIGRCLRSNGYRPEDSTDDG